MTTAHELPPGLEPWGEALAALTPALATALLPMVHALEDLFGRRAAALGDEGVPDGYDGLTTRGIPERIALSEWAIADEAPMEFLRRAATGELLHLRQARRLPRRSGRVVVLVDDGPEQHGAPRLAQLAALVVLHRRAHASGGELAVGLLGAEPGDWLGGGFANVLRAWRGGRAGRQPAAAAVEAWEATLERGDESWLLASAELGATVRRQRVATIRERTWSAAGTATLHVELDHDAVELTMPRADLGVSAFRGAGYARTAGAATAAGVVRHPSFASHARRLLLRGADATELLSVVVSEQRGARAPRPKRYEENAPVVAAAVLGRRLVILLAEPDALRVRVAGKPLPWLDDVAVPYDAVGAERTFLTGDAGVGLPPLHLLGQSLLAPLGGRWFALSGERAEPKPYAAVTAGPELHEPLFVARAERGLLLGGRRPLPVADPGSAAVVAGGGRWVATSGDGETWQPASAGQQAGPIRVAAGSTVVALVEVGGLPHLVTHSPEGLILRLVNEHGARVLTRWSGSDRPPSVHPSQPWLAVARGDDVVEVGNYLTNDVVQVVRGTA